MGLKVATVWEHQLPQSGPKIRPGSNANAMGPTRHPSASWVRDCIDGGSIRSVMSHVNLENCVWKIAPRLRWRRPVDGGPGLSGPGGRGTREEIMGDPGIGCSATIAP